MGTAGFSVDDHFDGKSTVVRDVYDKLMKALRKIGDVREEPKKTSIHLVRASALAGVETRKDYLLLNIKSDHRIKSARVTKWEQVSAGRHHHKVKLDSPRDVDAELCGWLQAAYEISD